MPNSTSPDHLDADDFFRLAEGRTGRRRLREVEDHLDGCAECVETLAMVLRSERLATREEEALLARMPPAKTDEVVARLRPFIESSRVARRAFDWRPLAVAAVLIASSSAGGWYVLHRFWFPAESRRIAAETLAAMVELRGATGRIPLRYLLELERASVTRSGFDDSGPEEAALLDNLRAAVERAPVPEAELVLGLLSLDEGELDEAEKLLTRVLDSNPRSVDALNGLAVVHYEKAQRQPEESYRILQRGLAILRKAQQASPEDLRVLYNFGKYYEALEMREAAVLTWSRYLEKDPSSQWGEEAAYQLSQLLPQPVR